MKNLSLFLLFCLLTACNSVPPTAESGKDTAPAPAPGHFDGALNDYWYQGKAEIATYELEQARYGELRSGSAVLIQVSEDFLTDEQVKNDKYENPNSAPIIKTNLIKRFTTGIYDYSLMTSVFTPAKPTENAHTFKVSTTAQDWCGQSFTQLNYTGGNQWEMQLRSYFEAEGDQREKLTGDWLEDEIFNRIRAGGELPTGSMRVIPATAYLLMTHQPYTATEAEVSLIAGDSTMTYQLEYEALQRTVAVNFDSAPPHVIRSWSETYPTRGKMLTSTATLKELTLKPYWSLNATKDDSLRLELGL